MQRRALEGVVTGPQVPPEEEEIAAGVVEGLGRKERSFYGLQGLDERLGERGEEGVITRRAFLVHPAHQLDAAPGEILDARKRAEAPDGTGVDVGQVGLEPGRGARLASQAAFRVQEEPAVGLYLPQEPEPLAPALRQAFLQRVAQDARGLSACTEAHVLHVGVQHEGHVRGDIDPLTVHRGDELQQAVQEAVQRGALERIAEGHVVGVGVEAGKPVAEKRKQGAGVRQDNE